MAASPPYKVYDSTGDYIASCHHAGAASALADLYGPGSTVRWRHRQILWREGEGEDVTANFISPWHSGNIIRDRRP